MATKQPKGQLVMKVGFKKVPGYLYFLSSRGDIMKVKMSRGKRRTKPTKMMVKKLGVKRELGFIYFIDGRGDVRRVKARWNKSNKPFKVKRGRK